MVYKILTIIKIKEPHILQEFEEYVEFSKNDKIPNENCVKKEREFYEKTLRNLRSRKNQEPSGLVPRLPFRLYFQVQPHVGSYIWVRMHNLCILIHVHAHMFM